MLHMTPPRLYITYNKLSERDPNKEYKYRV